MKLNKKQLTAVVIFVVTIILGISVFAISWRLQQQKKITEGEASAASIYVTSADLLDTLEKRAQFYKDWQDFAADSSHDWKDFVDRAMTVGARYDCDKDILKVGSETLYGCDLNALFVLFDFAAYTTAEEITPANSRLNAVIDALITDSGLLQKADELGYLTIDNTFFNSSAKDMYKRYEMTKLAREKIGDAFVKRVDFEILTMYFYDEIAPSILSENQSLTQDAVKAIVKKKMDFIYEALNSGDLTMEEAGKLIMEEPQDGTDAGNLCYTNDNNEKKCSDTAGYPQGKIDRLYSHNAYADILGHEFGVGMFVDSVYDEELRSLGVGQMSTVRLAKDYAKPKDSLIDPVDEAGLKFQLVDSCYLIFKVNDIYFEVENDLGANTASEVEQKIKDSYYTEE